jgi:hypothetical protein
MASFDAPFHNFLGMRFEKRQTFFEKNVCRFPVSIPRKYWTGAFAGSPRGRVVAGLFIHEKERNNRQWTESYQQAAGRRLQSQRKGKRKRERPP